MSNYIYLILILIGLPAFLLVYRLIPYRHQKTAIIVGSLVYYAVYTDFSLLSLGFMLLSVTANYFFQFPIKKIKNDKARRTAIWLIVILNLLPLLYVKITGVTITGISFYTFTLIALQADLYRGTVKRRMGFKEYALFLGAYPRLAMGPIARYMETKPSLCKLKHGHGLNSENLDAGLKTFIVGLGMKLLLADQLGTIWTGICTSGTGGIVWTTAWLGALAYTLELYFDFWGYSLIAIGLGRMIGMYIPVNFDQPYMSKTVSEFWRRWHITLGKWFRDYIYIPMGGNRCGKARTILNLSAVWLITGLWHGFGFNYLIWGCILGLLVILEKFTPLGKLSETKVLGHLYIIILMPLTWMVFANTDLSRMLAYLGCMFGLYPDGAIPAEGQFLRYLSGSWYILLASIVLLIPQTTALYEKIKNKKWSVPIFMLIFGLSLYVLYTSSTRPFMYAAF